ncbi:MAG: hypothetical protein JNK72_10535 [Myxococcales bacterium]|nr:hypothetical protein [Myxococcales bacterium]
MGLGLCLALGAAAGCRRAPVTAAAGVSMPTRREALRALDGRDGARVFEREGRGPWVALGQPAAASHPSTSHAHAEADVTLRSAMVLAELCLAGGCAILPFVPVILLAEALDRGRHEVLVRRNGRVEHYALFDRRDAFVLGRHDDGREVIEVATLPLTALGQRVVVETQRVAYLPDGRLGLARPSPIDPQTGLVAQYQRAVRGARDADRKAALTLEALRWMQREALPLLATPDDSAATATLLRRALSDRGRRDAQGIAWAAGPLVDAAEARRDGDTLSLALSLGAGDAGLDLARRRRALVRAACGASTREDWLGAALGGQRPDDVAALVREAGCSGPLAAALAGQPFDAAAAVEVVSRVEVPSLVDAVLARFDRSDAAHQRAMWRLAPRRHAALVWLAGAEPLSLTADDAAAAVAVWRAERERLFRDPLGALGSEERERAARWLGLRGEPLGELAIGQAALAVMARASLTPQLAASASAALDAFDARCAARLNTCSGESAQMHLALGRWPATPLVVTAYERRCPWVDGAPRVRPDTEARCELSFVLWSLGCTEPEVRARFEAAARHEAPSRCASGPRSQWPASVMRQWRGEVSQTETPTR